MWGDVSWLNIGRKSATPRPRLTLTQLRLSGRRVSSSLPLVTDFFRNSQSEIFGNLAYLSAILSGAVYACAVRHHFSTRTLKDEVKATWEETFYPDGFLAAQAEKIMES